MFTVFLQGADRGVGMGTRSSSLSSSAFAQFMFAKRKLALLRLSFTI